MSVPPGLQHKASAARGVLGPSFGIHSMAAVSCELRDDEQGAINALERMTPEQLRDLSVVIYNLEIKVHAMKEQKEQEARHGG